MPISEERALARVLPIEVSGPPVVVALAQIEVVRTRTGRRARAGRLVTGKREAVRLRQGGLRDPVGRRAGHRVAEHQEPVMSVPLQASSVAEGHGLPAEDIGLLPSTAAEVVAVEAVSAVEVVVVVVARISGSSTTWCYSVGSTMASATIALPMTAAKRLMSESSRRKSAPCGPMQSLVSATAICRFFTKSLGCVSSHMTLG